MDTFEGSVRHCYTVMGSCWRGCWLANGRSIPMIPHTVVPQIQRAASHTKNWDPCSLHFSSHLPEQCFWGWEPEVMGGHGEALKCKFSTLTPIQKVRVSKSDSPSKMDGLAGNGGNLRPEWDRPPLLAWIPKPSLVELLCWAPPPATQGMHFNKTQSCYKGSGPQLILPAPL